MKNIIVFMFILFCTFTTVTAQNYTQNGTTFVESKVSNKSNSIETKYTWQDREGKMHKIYLSKNGRAFIKATSKKTGNEYNKYLEESISIKLSKEYGIDYIPKEKRK